MFASVAQQNCISNIENACKTNQINEYQFVKIMFISHRAKPKQEHEHKPEQKHENQRKFQ